MSMFSLFWLFQKTSYDQFAEAFHQTRQRSWPEFSLLLPLLLDASRPLRLLDIGCGNGRLLSFLKEQAPERFLYTGIDTSRRLLALAREHFPKENFVQGNMAFLPFPAHRFDIAVAIASFSHLTRQRARQEAFFHFFRVLCPGGSLMLTVWDLSSSRFASERLLAERRARFFPWWNARDLVLPFGKKKIPRLYRWFAQDELFSFAKSAGFVEIDLQSNGKNIVLRAKKPRKISLLGISLDMLSFSEALLMFREGRGLFSTINPEILQYAALHPAYHRLLTSATAAFPDGMGILWAGDFVQKNSKKSWLFLRMMFSLWDFLWNPQSSFFPERVSGSDLFSAFCSNTQDRVFLLGGAPGAAKKCAEIFSIRSPDAHFFWDEGSRECWDDERLRESISQSGATTLFVAFGAPWQEEWIARNLSALPSVERAMGVGGSFDFQSGQQQRAPYSWQKAGLEWLYRLLRDPRKRAYRIYTAVIRFPLTVCRFLRQQKKGHCHNIL